MGRRFLVVLFTLGAVGGFGSALRHHYPDRREAFERHVADLCTDAAHRSWEKAAAGEKR